MMERPTFKELLALVRADFATASGPAVYLRRTLENVASRAVAGMAHGLHGRIDDVARQSIPDRADDAQVKRWAALLGMFVKDAIPSTGPITVTGAGGTVPVGTAWTGPNDAVYTFDVEVADITSESAAVTAQVAGTDGNLDAGAVLTLVSPIAGVDSVATIEAPGIAGGLEVETVAQLLIRFLARLQRAARGGGPTDHIAWAREVPGVTRAWEYPHKTTNGGYSRGAYAVAFVCDNLDPIIPDAAKVAEVQAYLEARSSAEAVAFAPTAVPYDFSATLTPATAAVFAAANGQVQDMLLREAEPGGTVFRSLTDEALSLAAGEENHTLTSPTADKTHVFGELATFTPGTLS